MALKILICTPDASDSEKLVEHLKENHYESDIALDGKDAQLKIYNENYFAIIVDFKVKNNSSFEVVRYIRTTRPTLKVIFTIESVDELKKHAVVVDVVVKLGVNHLATGEVDPKEILKQIEGKSEFSSWKEIKKNEKEESKEEEVSLGDDEFTKIKINEIYSQNVTVFDLYIRISEGKYIKILHQGDSFSKERLKKYQVEKKVAYLYFLTKDRRTYINYTNELVGKMNKVSKIPTHVKLHSVKNVTDKFLEEVHTNDLNPQLIEEAGSICQNMYDFVKTDKKLYKIMRDMEGLNPKTYTHQFLVSFFSSALSANLFWVTEHSRNYIVLGALMHDIGKMEFPPEMFERNFEDFTDEEKEIYRNHPELGQKILTGFSQIREPVVRIAAEHHEATDGSGFPNGLSGIGIFQLAKIVGDVNRFVDYMQEKEKGPLDTFREISKNATILKTYDSENLKALVKSFIDPERAKFK